jgi:cytochrome c biogenesis protein CcmG, thiol:disulfide interchange protein DsbE
VRLYKKICKEFLVVVAVLSLTVPLSAHAIISKGALAPPLSVVTMSGQNVTLANYRGYVLVMDFFATWCAPCRLSIPHLVDLNNRYNKQGLQVLGLSLDEGGEKAVKAFITDKKITYPVAMANEDLYNDYGLRSLPTLFVLNKKGIIVERYLGFNDEIAKSMETLIKKLLAE